MFIIKLLSGLAFIGSVAWLYAQRDYEPAIGVVTSLLTFIGAYLKDPKHKPQANQSQTVGKNGIGIQAGGNITVGDIHADRKEEDAK